MINVDQYTQHKHPGKFEGESPATEYFYDQAMNGDGEPLTADDEDSGPTGDLFYADVEESEAFKLGSKRWYLIRYSSDGFVLGSAHATRAQAEAKFREWAR